MRSEDTILGFVTINGGDFPWLYADFAAAHAFAEVKPLFDRAAPLFDSDDEAWEEAYEAVDTLGIRLVNLRIGEIFAAVGVFRRDTGASFR